MRKLIRGCLKNMGFTTVLDLTPTGNIFRTLVAEKAHVLICNGETPEMKEWELVKLLRNHPEVCKTKVVIVSGNSDKESILGAVRAGVDDYLIIPFSASALEERIRALFAVKAGG
ncbi:MAG: response regulator [Candidatus Tectomicrobia bacterium]|uniref:Response regulator n=1 Tax=Tectimicrobiota bacterium TaxID=2528274 RepID=A0A932M2U4_UNCTE|nr:response regulator [Candidatus Tectomicrobia bacterium]